MTTTAQPLNLKGLIVAFVMVCVGLAFLSAFRAIGWANHNSASDSPINQTSGSMFFWISLLVFLYASVNDFLVFSIVSAGCWSDVIGMIVAPTPNGSSAAVWIFGSPNSCLKSVPARIGTETVSHIYRHKWSSAFTTLFLAHKYMITETDERIGENLTGRLPEYSLSNTKFNDERWLPNGTSLKFSISCIAVRKGTKNRSYCLNFVGRAIAIWLRKLSLIDSEGEIPNEAETSAMAHRERLSERASLWDGAIVRTIREMNRMRLAEMTNPLQAIAA